MADGETLIIRAEHLPPGETQHIKIVHLGPEVRREYLLSVSRGGLYLRFIGKGRTDLAPSTAEFRLDAES